MAEDQDSRQDPALPDRESGEIEVPEELGGLAEQPVKRSGFAARVLGWARDRLGYGERREDRPSIRECVFLFDFEDAFPETPKGEADAKAFVSDLARKIREPVVPVPRGLTMVVPMKGGELEMLDLTSRRK